MPINPTWPADGDTNWGDPIRASLDEVVDAVNANEQAAADNASAIEGKADASALDSKADASALADLEARVAALEGDGGEA